MDNELSRLNNELIDLSRLNNELIHMQREMALQNVALERAQVELELRVQSRTLALQSAVEEAERANAAKSEFLSRMSHELRTPMNSILGFAQIMEMDSPSETQAQRIAHIMKAGQRLLQLIDELLDVASGESERSRQPSPKSTLQKEEQDDTETPSPR